MPTLPLPPGGTALHGGDLPVSDGSDVLEQFSELHRIPGKAPIRDALVESFAISHTEFQDSAAASIAQSDPLRATKDHLVAKALEHEVVPLPGESESSLRARIFATPKIVSPQALVDEINELLAPLTDLECQLVELEMDGLFIHDGTAVPEHEDPLTYRWTGYWIGYPGAGWGSIATAGPSYGCNLASVGAAPTLSTLNSLGIAGFSTTRVFDNNTPSVASSYLSASAWSFVAMVKPTTVAPGVHIALDSLGAWRVGIDSLGRTSVSHYTGITYAVSTTPLTAGVWSLIQARYNGIKLEIRLNDEDWVSIEAPSPLGLSGSISIGGPAGAGVGSFDGFMSFIGISDTCFSYEEFDSILYNLRATFVQTLGVGPAWDSFIGAQPRYPDRYYEEDAAENDGFFLENNNPGGALVSMGYPRSFHILIPVLDAVDEDFAFALDSEDEIMVIGDASDTAGSESDGTGATSIYSNGATADDVYSAIVAKVNSIKGQGISWSAYCDPEL